MILGVNIFVVFLIVGMKVIAEDVMESSSYLIQSKRNLSLTESRRSEGAVLSKNHGFDGENRLKINLENVVNDDKTYLCRNGGTFVKVRGEYECICPHWYRGKYCEIGLDVCSQHTYPDGRLPCVEEVKTCEVLIGGGFACRSVRQASTGLHDVISECVKQSPCPAYWVCVALGRDDFRCEPPRARRIPRSPPACGKRENLCENGAKCEAGRCVCLKHFDGEYCNEIVDYCSSNPCPLGVHCEPTLGGFSCDCTALRRGPTCDIKKKEAEEAVRGINFLYIPKQNSGSQFTYCLYATSITSDTVINIDFGDGLVVKDYAHSFKHFTNFRIHLLKTFYPPLLTLRSNVDAYTIEHTYVKPGYYNLLVDVIDDQYSLFNSSYTVNVGHPNFCSLSLKLQNCAQSMDDALYFHTKDSIEIMSDIHINCTDAKFNFNWSIHKVNETEDRNESNRMQLSDDIDVTGNNLFIPKFSLQFGMYIVHLELYMTGHHSQNTTADTWFIVEQSDIRPHIEGNSVMMFLMDSPIVLDASITHDTRYESERQLLQSYNFTWSCESPKDTDYCSQNPLKETGPILSIPPHTLKLNIDYQFYVSLFEPDNKNRVQIRVLPAGSAIFRIECVENCGETIDPTEMIALRATCYGDTCDAPKDTYMYEWSVTVASKTQWHLEASQTEFGLKDEMLIIRNNVLKHSTSYDFDLISYFGDMMGLSGRNGASRIVKPTIGLIKHIESNCSISPLTGYSVFTNFTITCQVAVQNSLLSYEVAQLKSIANATMDHVWVSYGTVSPITNIRLSSGSADLGHLTTVQVTIRSKDSEAFFLLNVTVFPATFQAQFPQRLFQDMYHHLFGSESELAILHTARNCYRVVQVIRCAAAEVHELINVEYAQYFDEKYRFIRDICVLRESMLEYLSQQNVSYLEELKHFAVTTIILLKLPCKRIIPSTVQVINTIYKNIIQSVKTFTTRDIVITKSYLREIGESLVTMGSMILKKAILLTSDNSSEMHYEEYEKEYNIWAFKKLIGIDMHKAPLIQLTTGILNSILAFYKMQNKYLSFNGPVIEVQKGEFSLIVWKASFIRLDNVSLELLQGSVIPYIGKKLSKETFIVTILQLEYNPYWWHDRLKYSTFPYFSIDVFVDNPEQTRVLVPARVELDALKSASHPTTLRVELSVVPFWMFNESHITTYRLKIPENGKLALYFAPNKEKIQFVVKKGVRPVIHDFWDNGITLPEADKVKSKKLKLSVIEDMDIGKEQSVFLGIMPHISTLRKLLEADNAAHNFRAPMIVSDEGHEAGKYPNVAHLKAKSNVGETQNISLPFEFAVLIAQCYNFNQSSLKLSSMCFVNDSKSHMIACTCTEMSHPMIEIKNIWAERTIIRDESFSITSQENPVILFFVLYIISIFTVMFIWAWFADREDRRKRDAIFLRDNHPMHTYTYVLIVYTGRRPGSGTTSKVAIQLIGEEASSSVHILADRRRRVLTRGSQEWFILKTEQYLGNLSWINLWHDHTGASPSWFCDKVVVHDIQTQEVWLFVTSQWLAPLHGDGSMSCSVDQTRDLDLFRQRFRFPEYFMDTCDRGHHGWISMLHTQTGDTFTRCQRVGVSLTYAAIITAIVARIYAGMTSRYDNALHVWSLDDFTTGLYAALLAWPVYVGLYWLFRCIEPMSLFEDSPLYSTRSLSWNPSTATNRLMTKDDVVSNDGEDNRRRLPYIIKRERNTSTKATASKPMKGGRTVDVSFCLPAWCIYFAWLCLLLIVSVCAYLSTFHGITLSNALSICFLISFVTAIVSSILLETVKVALIAIFYSLFAKTKLMAIEDRSELVRNIDQAYAEKNVQFMSQKLEEVSTWRKWSMYKPISYKRVELLRKNAISEATTRHIVRDLCIFLLASIVLACICNGIRDSKQYYHVYNIKNVVNSVKRVKSNFPKITNQDEYVIYINKTIIPNIYMEYDYNDKPLEKGYIADWTNYLIGVPRLRQLRLSKASCADVFTSKENWDSHCSGSNTWIEGDTKDYNLSWKTLTDNDNDTIWVHHDDVDLETGATIGKVSIYPGSGYVALLERTADGSKSVLTRLYETEWIDPLTVALFLEFALYNANLKLVSMVSLLGERSITGGYHVSSTVQAIKADTTRSTSKTFTLAVFVTLIIVMIVRIRGEDNRIARLSQTRYIGNCWYALRILVVILGALAISLFVVCEFMTISSMKKLSNTNTRQFVNFYGIIYWIEVLTVVLAMLFFLIILELWHIISFYFEFQIVLTTLYVSSYNLFFYLIMFTVFILAFVWTGHLLFLSSSFKFRTVWSTIVALCGFSQQYIFDDKAIYFFENPIGFGRGIFYLMFFVTFMFILRWGFALILINKYKIVTTYAQNAWIDPILNWHVRAKCASRPFLRMQKMTRDYLQAIGILLKKSSRSLSKARFRAMVQIVRQSHDTIDPEFLSHAKNIAMTALVVDEIEERRNKNKTALISRAEPLVRTSFRMSVFQNKIQTLNVLVTNLLDNNEM